MNSTPPMAWEEPPPVPLSDFFQNYCPNRPTITPPLACSGKGNLREKNQRGASQVLRSATPRRGKHPATEWRQRVVTVSRGRWRNCCATPGGGTETSDSFAAPRLLPFNANPTAGAVGYFLALLRSLPIRVLSPKT